MARSYQIWYWTTVLSLAALCVAVPVASDEAVSPSLPEVDLGYVRYRGAFHEDIDATIFHALPYAFPPLANLRWKAPLPIDSDHRKYTGKDAINASTPNPSCIQGHPAWDFLGKNDGQPPPISGTESCLTLDVLTPSSAFKDGKVNAKLPVVVKIHGGGYTMGGSDWTNGLTLLPHAKDSLIFVAIQYRLGAYGFLGGEQYRKEGGVTNAGLLDQRAALEWVKKYISKFGGDPEKVTIWGGSAGGGSVTAQMMMYGGQRNPPFRNAIGEYPWWQPYHGESILDAQYKQMLKATNCGNLDCMRTLPEAKLSAAAQQTFLMGYNAGLYGFGDFYYGPSVDGQVLLGLPSDEYSAGRFSNVPVLATRDRYEGYFFSNLSTTTFEQLVSDLKDLIPNAPESFMTALLNLYPERDYNSTFYRREALFGDMFVNCPSTWLLESVYAKGQGSFKMIFDAGNQKHAATDAFLFGNSMNETIAVDLREWYLSFALNSDPNAQSWKNISPKNKPYWPSYGSNKQVLVIDERDMQIEKDMDLGERCKFWHQNSAITRNHIVLQEGFQDR